MKPQATIGGAELLLGVIAIRLAMLVFVGWSLTLLPQQARNAELACAPPVAAAASEAQASLKNIDPRVIDAAFADMLRHD